MKKILVYLVFMCVLWSCGTASKTTGSIADTKVLDDMVAQKAFEIAVDWAVPQASSSMNAIANSGLLGPGNSAGRIDLMGDGNYVKMQGDSVSAYLAYFGERRSGGGYGSNEAIEFMGLAKDLTIEQSTKDQSYRIQFDIDHESEFYKVDVWLYPNLNCRIGIVSSQRSYIRYEGRVSELNKEETKL